ncbi:MAG: hypothetical protein LBM93_10640 [Oscillospiraceae bacterium]|jgi:diadenosine tetraphosphate (Ap4A) HIT family hydrolase/nucleoside 2-deoxyribosyltransferase|nr:hypothetical protein [Oscillospiraceae bacterium]
MQDCIFCDIIENGSDSLTNTILYEDSDFYIVPALDCFVTGYVLIISKEHTNSMCYLSKHKKEHLKTIIHNLSEQYFYKYGFYPLVFEHGAKYDCANLSGCCIQHAHMHVVPHKLSSFSQMNDKIKFEEVKTFDNFYDKCSDKPYLFFMDNNKKKFISNTDMFVVPSQFFRQVIALDMDTPSSWDWRINRFDKKIYETVIEIGYILKNKCLSKKHSNIQNIYYCRAMDGFDSQEIKQEYIEVKNEIEKNGMNLINMYKDNHNMSERNKTNSALIRSDNTSEIDKADCLIVNLSIKNHQYVGCLFEMMYAKEHGHCFIIIVTGDSNIAERWFYITNLFHKIVKTVSEAIEYIKTNKNMFDFDE